MSNEDSIDRKVRRQWHRDRFVPSASCVEVACTECGRQMWLPPSKVGEYLTCGGKCAKAKREKLKAARARKCETCGKEFHPRWRQIRAGGGRFCSPKCNTD